MSLIRLHVNKNRDHVYFVHPSTNISVDISTDTRPIYHSTLHQSSHGFATFVHVFATKTKALAREIPPATQARSGVSADMSADILIECRSICRLRCDGRHGTDISVEHRSMCRQTIDRYFGRPRVVVQLSAVMSIDRLLTFRRSASLLIVYLRIDDRSLRRRHNLTCRLFCKPTAR